MPLIWLEIVKPRITEPCIAPNSPATVDIRAMGTLIVDLSFKKMPLFTCATACLSES